MSARRSGLWNEARHDCDRAWTSHTAVANTPDHPSHTAVAGGSYPSHTAVAGSPDGDEHSGRRIVSEPHGSGGTIHAEPHGGGGVTASDRPAFAEFMLGLGEAYGESVSEARLEIYFAALEDLSLERIRQAGTLLVRTQKFFPRVAELRDALTGSVDDRAELAWVAVLNTVRAVGYWGEPAWADPAAERAALDLYGGWKALCERLPAAGPELLGVAKQFKATYAAYARRELATLPPGREEAKALLGTLMRELEKRGLPTPGLRT